jgi:hypothetical protein
VFDDLKRSLKLDEHISSYWAARLSHPTIGLVLIAIGVELEYRYVSISLSGWGPKGEPNAPITTESEMMDLLRLLRLIWQSNMSILAIRVEPEYRSVIRSLFEWGPKGESNAVEVDLMIELIHNSYHRWERGHKFLEAVEVDLTIGLVHDSYRRWERCRRFLLWMKVSCCLIRASRAILIGLE